jgi:hypothetical protein
MSFTVTLLSTSDWKLTPTCMDISTLKLSVELEVLLVKDVHFRITLNHLCKRKLVVVCYWNNQIKEHHVGGQHKMHESD